METIDLESWSGFAAAIADIRGEYGTRDIELPDGSLVTRKNDIVFRGQPDSNWSLKTTLERTTAETFSIEHYLQRADSVVNEVESYTHRDWKLPAYPDIVKEIKNVQDSLRTHVPCYEYLVYLRHHGFPSPLLDWTRSPYVAAFFALEQPIVADRASVFAFIECPLGGKFLSAGDATIDKLGPYITTHARHFAQKATYTIATKWDREKESHFFCSHHDVQEPAFGAQDLLIKITLPRSDRIEALRQLDDYNITHYTLFQSEDALVRSLGLRAFELDGP